MANIKSQKKRNLQNVRRHERNKAVRSELKTRLKNADKSAAEGAEDTAAQVQRAVKALDMAGRIDQVEDVVLPRHPHVLGLDGDAPFPLDVHRVEVLGLHVAHVDGAGELEDAVGERRLAVVDVGDDAEIAELLEPGHTPFSPPWGRSDEPPAPLLA